MDPASVCAAAHALTFKLDHSMGADHPLVDRKVLEFVRGNVFDPADFGIRTDGVCRLNPEMAKSVVELVA
jgi:hypothetical protein